MTYLHQSQYQSLLGLWLNTNAYAVRSQEDLHVFVVACWSNTGQNFFVAYCRIFATCWEKYQNNIHHVTVTCCNVAVAGHTIRLFFYFRSSTVLLYSLILILITTKVLNKLINSLLVCQNLDLNYTKKPSHSPSRFDLKLWNKTANYKTWPPSRHSGQTATHFSVFEIKRENDSAQIKINGIYL